MSEPREEGGAGRHARAEPADPTILLAGERAAQYGLRLAPWTLISRSGGALPRCDLALVSGAHEVARLHAEAPHLPVIAVAQDAAEASRLFSAGASDALIEPFDDALVRSRILALLRLCARVAEAERAQVRHRTSLLFEALDEGIVELDLGGVVLSANESAARILGRPLLGRRLFENGERVVDASGQPVRHSDLPPALAARDRKPVPERVLGVHAGGRVTWISVSTCVLHDRAGAVTGFASSIADVTARRKLEVDQAALVAAAEQARENAEAARRDAEQAALLKDQFLATLSHEMRTPLTSILGWVRLLRLGRASVEPGSRALESIERNARLQSQLVSDLLDLQRMTSGKMSLAFRDVELGSMVDAVVSALAPAAAEASVRVRVASPLDEELHVFGDADRLHQSIASLISNAIKFSRAGGSVQVTLQPMGTEVLLSVRDEGRGIRKGFVPHVFENFRQEDSTIVRDKGGLGVGLALVRHIVELHSGTVSAESRGEGQGSYFTVMLPLRSRVGRPAARPPPPAETPPPAVRLGGLQGVQILVVEDDLDTQYLIAAILEQAGARVWTAGSAAEAFAALSAGHFDLLLSDISMPGEDGYSLVRRVRAGGVHRDIPAAALTANARPEDKARALASGFHAHIAKPVEPTDLVRLLSRLLGG